MNSVKELLHNTIEQLDDEEARQLLEIAQNLSRKDDISKLFERLAGNPTFTIPLKGLRDFPVVKPVKSDGIPASKLLVEDRR